ncbi:hypothetical protein D3C76_954320 [compost metagenome]
MLHSRGKPVTQEILPHGQAKTADHDQAQPPVIEGDGPRHNILVVASPVDDEAENERRECHGLDDGDQGVVTEISHHRTVQTEANEQRNGHQRSSEEQPRMVDYGVSHLFNA